MFVFGNREKSGRKVRALSKTRLRFEPLEERRLLTVITVNDLGDYADAQESGNGIVTLRDAIKAANLNEAVGNAPAGDDHEEGNQDIIQFASGLSGTIYLTAGELVIEGPLTINGSDSTVITIDAQNGSRIFSVDDGDIDNNITVTIQGLTLINGNAPDDGGAIDASENLTLNDIEITDSTAGGSGGGVWFDAYMNATLTIENSTISGNTAAGDGGGIGFDTYSGDNATVTIRNSTITGNTANGTGGGIYGHTAYSSEATSRITTIENCFITDNHALSDTQSGGGIRIRTTDDGVTKILNSTISGNTAAGKGAGIAADNDYGGKLVVENSIVSGNTADGDGGGLYAQIREDSTLEVLQSRVLENKGRFGGGLALAASYGSATIKDSTISDNAATNDGGGVHAFAYNSSTTIYNSTISGNTNLGNGGGIWANVDEYSSLTLRQSTISGNGEFDPMVGAVQKGGGLYLINYGSTIIRNSTITGNHAVANGGGIYAYYEYDTTIAPVIVSSIIAKNTSPAGPDIHGSAALLYSLLGDNSDTLIGDGGNNQIGDSLSPIDPKLEEALADNGGPTMTHKLLSDSPAINSGSALADEAYDQRGSGFLRVYGVQADMGAYEISPPITTPEITVLQNTTNILSGTTTIDFGTIAMGSSPVAKTFTIRNDGQQPLILTNLLANTLHFTVGQPAKTTLLAGESTTFAATLKTNAAWTGSETILIQSNEGDNGDGVENPFELLVSATVTAPQQEITVLIDSAIITDGQTTPILIGYAAPGQTGVSKTFTIRNDGSGALELDAGSFVNTTHFIVSTPVPLSLAVGQSTTFTVTLKTDAIWSGGSELISFTNNDADNGDGVESPFTFLVSGKVTISGPEISVLDGNTNIANGQSTPIALDAASHNGTGPSKTFTIRNEGTQTLTLDAGSFVDADHFTVSLPTTLSLAGGQSATFTVTLKTDEIWSGAELISIGNNDADNGDGVENPFTFFVSGEVVPAGAEITVLDGATVIVSRKSTAIAIGSAVHFEAAPSKTFTIRNDGDELLILDPNTFVDTRHFFVGQPGATSLAPGESTTFTVALNTSLTWSGTQYIKFSSNDGDSDGKVENPFQIRVSGSVAKIGPEIVVSLGSTEIVSGQTAPIDLGSSVRDGVGTEMTFTIRNDGDTTLRLASPFASTEHFTVSRSKRRLLPAGSSTTFTVTLNTDAVWSGSEVISLYSNDADNGDGVESPFTFVVSGAVTPMPAEITVLDGETTVTSGATKRYDVGDAVRGGTEIGKTFTLRNDGDELLALDGSSFVDTAHFTVGQPGALNLAPGASTTFTVTLKTGEVWSGHEQISFLNDDADNGDGVESPFTFFVSGKVAKMPAEITVLLGTTDIVNGQTTAIDLGSAVRTTVGAATAITVRNDGDRYLRLSKPLAGTSHCIVGQPGDSYLSPGEMTTFTVQLNTETLWSGSETIAFFSTDADNGDGVESPFTFVVSGAVTAPLHDLTTIGGYDPTKSIFHLRYTNNDGPANLSVQYGPARSGWIPLTGDWNGNGVSTVGLYSPATSTFYLRNSNTPGIADMTFVYGPAGSGWTPIAGDWDGDGRDTIGLYNPATSIFYLRNTNSVGFADAAFSYGPAGGGWTPIAGDWDGDGRITVGLYNPATSVFFLRNSNTQGFADLTFAYGAANNGWTPIAGDWDGDGRQTIGLYSPTKSTFYLRYTNDQGIANAAFDYSPATKNWIPATGTWTLGNALLAADGVGVASSSLSALTQEGLQPIVREAIARWASAGLDDSTLAGFAQVQFVIADLPDSYLGRAKENEVFIDINAAGHGWFVDPTPALDEEFTASRTVDPQAVDQIDLLTVVEHELGHIAGLEDLDALAENLMSGALGIGVRRSS